jgi:hypothetical protein
MNTDCVLDEDINKEIFAIVTDEEIIHLWRSIKGCGISENEAWNACRNGVPAMRLRAQVFRSARNTTGTFSRTRTCERDENTYTTAMTGLKYKLAHKRAGSEAWSASEKAQRKHLVKILQEMIDDLSAQPEVEAPVRRRALATVREGAETRARRRTSSPARHAGR